MRIIFMRHGETLNNVYAKISMKVFEEKRAAEPELSDIGVNSCIQMGQKLKELGFQFDKIMCSGHKRAILSAKYLREGYGDS